MEPSITPIRLPLPFRLGSVNCYLIQTDTDTLLIDTGGSSGRAPLPSRLPFGRTRRCAPTRPPSQTLPTAAAAARSPRPGGATTP